MTAGERPECELGSEPPTLHLRMPATTSGATGGERGQAGGPGSEPPTVELIPSGSGHVELDLALLAGVSDRGLRHHRNEDAMALATEQSAGGPVALAVVCDGVSSSSRPDEAAQAAATAAMTVLHSAVQAGAVQAGAELSAAFGEAFDSAQQALLAMAAQEPVQGTAPSATFVSAVMTRADVTVCWLGDSRAYWLDATDGASSRQLTSDDSLGGELVSRGLLTEAEALALPSSHVVTGWIGADLSDAMPHMLTFAPPGPGVVLLCSDGLWNYEPEAVALAARAMPGAMSRPLDAAAALVSYANESGGNDNITAVVAPFPPGDRGTDAAPWRTS